MGDGSRRDDLTWVVLPDHDSVCIRDSKCAKSHSFRPVVARLDVVEATRVLERRDVPVKLAQPEVKCRVAVADVAEITLEVSVVCNIEANLYIGWSMCRMLEENCEVGEQS